MNNEQNTLKALQMLSRKYTKGHNITTLRSFDNISTTLERSKLINDLMCIGAISPDRKNSEHFIVNLDVVSDQLV